MKKVLVITFVGGLLLASCSKKADYSLQDSNTMLPEPDVATLIDSTAKPVAPETAEIDSIAKK